MHPVSAPHDSFSAIADPTRRRILELLAARECSVSELVTEFEVSQPAISQHLKVLREANLVTVEPVGRQRLYRINADHLREVSEWVAHFEKFWEERLDNLAVYLHKKKKEKAHE